MTCLMLTMNEAEQLVWEITFSFLAAPHSMKKTQLLIKLCALKKEYTKEKAHVYSILKTLSCPLLSLNSTTL